MMKKTGFHTMDTKKLYEMFGENTELMALRIEWERVNYQLEELADSVKRLLNAMVTYAQSTRP